MNKFNAIILIAYLFELSSCQSIVETESGFIQSTVAQSDTVDAFLGVPYAEPPIGDLKFAKPVPKQPWYGIYNASSLPPPCIQYPAVPPYDFFPNTSTMSEDCLYLNIWKPKEKPRGILRPIIIYIHYGAFIVGSSNQMGLDGSHLASQGNVVVVTINYRLGYLGFFLANIEEANGSMGMYDQIMAIEWVKNNAESFEGDPDNIILMGTSAGAISITAHIVSPLSRNLFRRAIILSGSIVSPLWADGNKKLFKSSEQIASIAGCTNETITLRSDPHSVLECLKKRPTEVLVEAQGRLMKTNPAPFYPRVGDQFLPEDAISAYRKGKFSKDIDVMIAVSKDEGSLFLLIGASDYFGMLGKAPFKVTRTRAVSVLRFIRSILKLNYPPEINSFYLDKVKDRTSDGYKKIISDIVGDAVIVCSSVFAADFLSLKGNRVYFYKFGIRGEASPFADWVGVMHGEDIQYIFGNPFYRNVTVTAEEAERSNILIARVSAFAYTGFV